MHKFVYIPVSEHFPFAKKLIQQHDSYTSAAIAGDNKKPLKCAVVSQQECPPELVPENWMLISLPYPPLQSHFREFGSMSNQSQTADHVSPPPLRTSTPWLLHLRDHQTSQPKHVARVYRLCNLRDKTEWWYPLFNRGHQLSRPTIFIPQLS